ALEALMLERGQVCGDELADGRLRVPARPLERRLEAGQVAAALARGAPTDREAPGPARFAPGDRVLARQMHPPGHTRLPRYARGRRGTVVAAHGAQVYPDTNGTGRGEQPAWLYTVSFEGAELWGADTSAASVCIDCWEPYLEPLGGPQE
ncbi:MAG: nitrile hydratase subunit beta, partial [Burkholderiales bacterium]